MNYKTASKILELAISIPCVKNMTNYGYAIFPPLKINREDTTCVVVIKLDTCYHENLQEWVVKVVPDIAVINDKICAVNVEGKRIKTYEEYLVYNSEEDVYDHLNKLSEKYKKLLLDVKKAKVERDFK